MSGSAEEILAGREICVCAGPGGVGKTTTSAAIAAGMAARGHKVLVLTIDPARRLADSLGLDQLDNSARPVDLDPFEAAAGGELWAMMLDARATFDEVVGRHEPDPEARQRILDNRIYRQLSGALAGSQEYMAMEKLFEIHEQGDYDLIVLDTPPSRNALDFLDAPRRLLQFIEGRSLRMFIRPTGIGMKVAGRGASVVFSLLRRITGLDLIKDLSEFFAAMSGMIGGFRERAARVEALLGDERTTFLLICGPNEETIGEAGFFSSKLADSGMSLGAVVVNRVHLGADGATEPDAEAVGAAVGDSGLAERVLDAARAQHALVARDAAAVAALRERLSETALLTVPYLEHDVDDLAGLLEVGRHLFGAEPV